MSRQRRVLIVSLAMLAPPTFFFLASFPLSILAATDQYVIIRPHATHRARLALGPEIQTCPLPRHLRNRGS